MRFAAVFSILVGILMLGQWAYFLATGNAPELKTAPRQIKYHLAAEFITALALILGGVALLAQSLLGYPFTLLALGMLLYTVINSPGYFAQRGEWALVIMFAVLLALSLLSVYFLIDSLFGLIRVGG